MNEGSRETDARTVAEEVKRRGETVAVAETSAGGLIAGSLISIAGASAWFVGGVVPYAPSTRMQWLGVGEVSAGAVSPAMAEALAEAVRARTGATWGVGETGVAGPQGGRRSRKPTGLGYVAVCGASGTVVEEVATGVDDRSANQTAFAAAALSLLARTVASESSA